MLLASCKKEPVEKLQGSDLIENDLTASEREFILSLETRLGKVEITEKSGNPDNPTNPFDYLGTNIRGMLSEVNQLEYSSPSSTASEYTNHWLSILPNYETGLQTNIVEDHLSLEARRLLAELIRSTIDHTNHQLSIEQIKFLEGEIAQSGLINAATREYLLAYSSMIRNLMWAIHNTGIVLSGTHYNHTDLPAAWWDCFDRYFEEAAELNFGVLVDWGNPIQTSFAWAGLPATIIGCVGDAIYNGVVNSANDPNC